MNPMVSRCLLWVGLALLSFGLTGCSGIAKGVTEAILEKAEEEDERACHVEGPSAFGLASKLEAQSEGDAAADSARTLKILMIHGIGTHLPGYSGRFTEHLMQALELEVRDETVKEIRLSDPRLGDQPLGTLRVIRFMDKTRTREVLFYELTWSEITADEKKVLAFDDSDEYGFRRTTLNGFLKSFFNSHFPDPLVYLGDAQQAIHVSVQQSFCWMTTGDWQDYPKTSDQTCDLFDPSRSRFFAEDDYAVVTHSLGSRIIIDVAQQVGDWAARQTDPEYVELRESMQQKELPIMMLANQLPLLELGRKPIAITGQIDDYCRPGGSKADERLWRELPIYAFSDPNDLLSYPVPPEFVNDYMDSRLCPRITNITINVTKPVSLFGLTDFANPLEAHTGYDHDERVMALIAHGIGHPGVSPLVSERCSWIETTRGDDGS